MLFFITNVHGEYWSRGYGWSTYMDSASTYTEEDTDTLLLPDGGIWTPLSN